MKLWLLRARVGDPLWDTPWDKYFGFVVRAETEAQARHVVPSADEDCEAWLDPAHSTCEELTGDGDVGVVLGDFHAG